MAGHRWALRGRHLLLFDAAATIISFVVSLALRFDAPSPQFGEYLGAFLWVIPLLLVARLLTFVVFRLYQRVWRYASVEELVAVVLAVTISSVVAYVCVYVVVFTTPGPVPGFPRSVVILDTALTIGLAGAWRFALRLAAVGRIGQRVGSGPTERALIVGDGSAALATIRELRANPSLALSPIGILADDLPTGQRLLGLPVLGLRTELQTVIRRNGIQVVLLALPSADGRTLRRLVRQAEAEGARCLTVPSIAEVVAGRVTMNAIREIDVEDLLRRAPARIDLRSVSESFSDSCILITGAGGSIGRELTRQVLAFRPRRLVLLGRGENSVFETMNSLSSNDGAKLTPVIMDVRERAQLFRLFAEIRPDVVFHAAAHKHVTFMETYPEEAVMTNVLGTANVLDAAAISGARRLVFISSDKAVNPTSVMGVTKRIGELLVHQAAMEHGLAYTSVRFGNVLSSRGSVIPLFRQQLARGGPLTVTDPDAMRYFMTIPEAVQLVLQAAVMANAGDTFVLDMGEPVRIVQLARDLIELHGLEPERDIKVEFIGQRPGEKLVEELYFASEQPERTEHEAIRRVRTDAVQHRQLRGEIERLRTLAESGQRRSLVQRLAVLVPEYTPTGDSISSYSKDDRP
jgi:FlaA1/EpsC-like NDP-sugar epimerase